MNPYIGITDFMQFSQVEEMLKVFNAHKPRGSNRKLHVGVMMSHKTLNNIPNEWQNAFPPKEVIADIFSSDEAYNCLHYADYDRDNTSSLQEYLLEAIGYGGEKIHALQLDMVWPDPWRISDAVRRSGKDIEIILQVGKNALEEIGDDPQSVVQMLEAYEGVIHRVLLDKSMGRGVGMNALELIPLAHAIRERFPNLGLVVAGGLGPKSVNLARPVIEVFPDISIDAQSKLRPSGSALDPVDWEMAGVYLIKALDLFWFAKG